MLLVVQIAVAITHRPANWMRPIGIIWFLGTAVLMVRRNLLRCPRCENRFFIRGFGRNHFARRCLHCGLPKWAPGPEETMQIDQPTKR